MIRRVRINNRLTSIMLVSLLVIGGFFCFIAFEPDVVSAATIYVGSGPGNHTASIQVAIDDFASDGDTIYVYNGSYNEHVVVDKTINLVGEDRNTTIIDGGGSGDVVRITVNWVNIIGFTVTGSGSGGEDAGIELNNVQVCSVINNIILNSRAGIYLYWSSVNNIAGNNVSSNNYNGIFLEFNSNYNNIANNTASNSTSDSIRISSSNYNTIINNIVSDNRYGIHLSNSRNNTLANNTMLDDGIYISGEFLDYWNTHTIDTTNRVNGRPVYYWKNQTGGKVPAGAGQIILANCTNVKIENQNVSNGDVGIQLGFSSNNTIINNTASLNNMYGIRLHFSESNTLTNNTAFLNGANGCWFYSSNNNALTSNNMSYNTNGIVVIQSSNYNTITDNDVFSNSDRGISIGSSSIGNTIKDNDVSNNFQGISIGNSGSNNNIINNDVSGNMYGIRIASSSDNNDIINNYVSNNIYGINLFNSDENNIIKNSVLDNGYGIYITSSSSNNNNIYHNNIMGNTVQAYDDSNNGNQWDDGYPSGGNYWSDFDESSEGAYDNYQGQDQDVFGSDGKVDLGPPAGGKNPYVIDADSQDNYPLINPADTSPPIITNLQPLVGSTTNDNTTTISADYNDPSGINVSSVVLIVDGIDVTSSAIVTAMGVSYTPGTALSDGFHTVYLEVKDNYDNLATATWNFTVDTTPPTITNLQPPDASVTNNSTPVIGADYSDPSGINVNSVLLEVDGIDVTPSATVTASGVSYIPITALPDGSHTVYLEVRDNYGNLATATWSFNVDTTPPTITNLQPPDTSATNDSTPTISADYNDLSGINVSSVMLKVDGIDVTSSATLTVGNVIYIPGMALSDGIYTVYLEVKDNVGNLATATWTFTVDTTPPTITNLQPPEGSTTNDSTPTTGCNYTDPSGINLSSVLLEVDGLDVTSSATVTASGVSYIPGMALSDGSHTVYLEVMDNYGNLATATWSFTVDATPPTITNLQPPDASTTNDNTSAIGADYSDLSGINVSSVVLEVDGMDVTSFATVTASGVVYTPGAVLSDGIHTVYLEVKDIYSNLATVTWNFMVDTLPPMITNLQPPDASTTNDNTSTISADYSDPSGINVSSVLLEVDGIDITSSAIVTVSGVAYIPGTSLPDGIHTVYLEVRDNLDNLATTTWNFIVDTTPPTITNLQPPDASIINNSTPTISANYSDPSGINVSSVVLEVDGIDVTSSATVTASNVSYIPGTALSDGIHTVYLEVKDNVNNLATATWSFTVDTSPPMIANLQPHDGSTTNDNTSIISADYSDPSGINESSVLLEVDGVDVTSSATVTASGVSYIPGTALQDGIHTVNLEVKDNYGNLATATWTFTVDTTPPTITNLQPPDSSITNDNTPTISGNYTDPSGINASSVVLKVDGIDVTSFALVTVSGVNYTPGTVLSDGIHTIYLEVRDNVNNLATVTWSFTVDTLPPIITNLQPPDTSTTNNTTPIISAEYSDPSGINLSSIILEVDGLDVTSSSVVTASGVTYTPGTALSDGIHTVYLEVRDNYGNLATATWSFTVDSTPPVITNLQPPNASITNNGTPMISADYSDPSNINMSSVVLIVDGIDVTPFAIITGSNVTYTPGIALSDDVHTVYLEVGDIYGNIASMTWTFTVDTLPPTITNLQLPDASITNNSTPMIGADYNDPSGINVGSVVLKVDGIDVTSSATVTVGDVSYLPGTALSDGIHTVYLEVKDNVNNLATATWTFTVDTTPPITTISPNNHTVKLGTLFTLTAADNVGGCGVNYTQYRIDDDQWIDYLGPFSIDTYGYHNITYRSVDNLGNIEDENTLSIYVPNVPTTTLIIGTPQYGTKPRYVNYSTQLSFSVIDYSGTGYDTYYYIDSLPPILYVGLFTVSTEGTHTIYFYSTDDLGNIEETKEFDIIVDNTPPTTDIGIGDPHYVFGDTWVTSAAEFTLNAVDGGLIPVGINLTMYRIWNGTWSEWGIYQDGFTLSINDGIRYVEFYSVDFLGNEEPVQNRSSIVDDTPPITTISVDDPKYKSDSDDIWNVTSATTFALSAIDEGVDLNYTEYRIWYNGSWSDWYKYTDGFRLGPDNGTKYVEWFSVDYLDNRGGTRNESYFVDNIPPETNYLLLLEPDNTEARLSLIPSDIGSGVDFTKYRIDSGDWIIYSSSFVINESGEHVIYFWSADRLGNIEETKEVTVLVEKPETPTPSDEEKKEANNKPLIALIFSIILLLVGSYVSYKRPLRLTGEGKKDRVLTWLIIVLPFVIAEIATGIVSLFTGMLSVPPLLGVGMIVDTAILVIGLGADGWIYKRGQEVIEESFE